jgi:hypothetical protein
MIARAGENTRVFGVNHLVDDGKTIFQPGSAGSVRPGTCLNGIYEIEKLIAQGGMGEVYRGFNIQTRDIVAIKMIRPELSNNPEVFDLFRREASILHTLQHEAIVRYFVFSVDPQLRRAYLAMEFVDGPSLTNKLASGPLSLADANILRSRISSALEAAHARGVVHRDVSSDNIIFPNGDVRSAKIIDFGIARALRPGEGTIIGNGFAGKYNYVSPEQLGLVGGDVTFKSDIYSFGLVLAEALRGRPIDMSGSQAEIIEKRRAAPDLSDIQPSIRPLIRSMLQPSPADRPASMAAVSDWREPEGSGGGRDRASNGGPPPAEGASRGGRLAAALGVIIAIVSIGGTAFVFRDQLPRLTQAPAPPSEHELQVPSGGLPQLALPPTGKPESAPPAGSAPPVGPEVGIPPPAGSPPLGPAHGEPEAAGTVLGSAPQAAPEAGTPAPAGVPPTSSEKPQVPNADMLADAMSPRAPASTLALSPATVDAPYRADLPPFEDPGGKGLRLSASSLPEGLTLKDLGQGKGEIQGEPKRAGSASVQIVATNHHDMTAMMVATIVIGEKPAPAAPIGTDNKPSGTSEPGPSPNTVVASLERPRPSNRLALLDRATVGENYGVDLPAFSAGANAGAITVRAASDPPAGLSLIDLGSGLARLSGKPARAGSYSFEVLATNTAGVGSPMTVRLEVAPAPPPPTENMAKLEHQDERADAFLRKFDGGDCFLVKPLAGAGVYEYFAMGADLAAFQRFEKAFQQEVRHDPHLSLRLITSPECPVVEIMLPAADEAAAPRIELADPHVGTGKPLAGTIANLRSRRLYLLLVDNEGAAYRLDAKIEPGKDAASFSVPLHASDAGSFGLIQLILAIVSDKPIPVLDTFRSGAAKTIAPQLVEAARSGAAAVDVNFFNIVN